MAKGKDIKYTIKVDEKGAIKSINQFESKVESTTKKGTKSFDNFGIKAAGAIAGIAVAVKGLEIAFNALQVGSKLAIQEKAFARLSKSVGSDSKTILTDLDKIAKGTISTSVMMEKAGTAMLLGIPADKLDELMDIARTTMQITGQTAEEAFGDIALAVGRGSKMILDNLGIIIDVEQAYEKYARKLNKTVEELTDVEKKEAFLNETIEKGLDLKQKIGENTEENLEAINRLTTEWKNLTDDVFKIFAEDIAPVVSDIVRSIREIVGLLKDPSFEKFWYGPGGKKGWEEYEKTRSLYKDDIPSQPTSDSYFERKKSESKPPTPKSKSGSNSDIDSQLEMTFEYLNENRVRENIEKAQETERILNELRTESALEAVRIAEEKINKETELENKKIAEEKRLWEDYEKFVNSINEELNDEIASTFKDTFKDMITGAESFEDAFLSMLDRLSDALFDFAIKQAAMSAANSETGWISMIGKFFGGKVAPAANGALWEGGFQAFASGGTVSKPTLGLIGEGKYNEAIVPLPDGKSIPVQMQGGGGTIVNNINISNSAPYSEENNKKLASEIQRQIQVSVKKTMSDEMKPGGIYHKYQTRNI